jgi:asparagine synthase (glutamine-hydrolysing)
VARFLFARDFAIYYLPIQKGIHSCMCGINGIFAYHPAAGDPDETELLRTRDYMVMRGPDGQGAWWTASRRCAFGHRRLSIIDLSENAAQPMIGYDGKYVVNFNGEIYNYPALRAKLEADGVSFATTSDTEVLLHLYARHGLEMVRELRGMFAFAIWDELQGGLFLARDPYGIKPLYTANNGWTFRFASQVKALLAGNKVSRDPEPAGMVGFHLFGSVPEPFTLYREIRALPAGHVQWIDSAGPREPKPYTSISAILAEGSRHGVAPSQLNQHVRAAVLDSVHAHLLADVEIGIFLSAGVDSGSLLGLMRDAGQQQVRAITVAFDEFRDTPEDEALHAARVAQMYGARHIVRRITKMEFEKDLPLIFQAMDQPTIDGVNTWFVAKAAKEAGLKVAISGLGGDELFAGYPSFVDVPKWRRRFGPFARIPGFGHLCRLMLGACAPVFARTQPKALGLLEYSGSLGGVYLLRRALYLPHELKGILDPEVVREGLRRLKPLRQLQATLACDPGSPIARICALESSHYLRNQLLRDADWAGMAHSLEIRVPFVDVSLLSKLAPAMGAFAPGRGKVALAHAPTKQLPEDVIVRAKSGFGVPIGKWIASRFKEASDQVAISEPRGLVSRRWSQAVLNGAS